VFLTRPPASPPPRRDLHLVRAVRRSFAGPAGFLADPGNRARVGEYLADMARAYGREVPAALFGEPPAPAALGHSYGEMAEALIGLAVPAGEPVDLLVLAFSVHDVRPGRQTAAYLSHVTPGAPMAFAVCDQGSAAAFSGLRIAREYASSADVRRALLIVVEQAALPYGCPATVPAQHRGVAMLYGDGAMPQARVADVRQHPGVRPGDAARLAAADLCELVAGHHQAALVLGDALAEVWTAPAAGRVRVMPPGQPSTGVWWGLIDELAGDGGRPDLLVAADYDAGLRYLCLTAFDTGPRAGGAAPPALGATALAGSPPGL
jgi:4-hydroxymandelate oxidase